MTTNNTNTVGDVALLVDWENIKRSLQDEDLKPNVTAIRETAERFGRLVIARAYADWADPWHRRDPRRLHDAGIEPIFVPTKASMRRGGRNRLHNSVDVKLAADCIDIIHRYSGIQTIVLASGDADFIHAINLVRPHGKQVVVIGVSWSAATRLIETVDEFIEYDKDIIQAEPAEPAGPALADGEQKTLEKALQLVPEIVASSRHPNRASPKWVRRELIKRIKNFDERKLGYDHFRGFLQSAEQRQLVVLATNDDMVEWVWMPGTGPSDPKTPAAPKPEDPLPKVLRFAHETEQKHDFVAFKFLLNRMMNSNITSLNRTQLASLLSDAVDDELFVRGQYQKVDEDGEVQEIRTIELNHSHPEVKAALTEDAKLAKFLNDLSENPSSLRHLQQVIARYVELEQWQPALDHQEKAIKLDPDNVELRTQKVILQGKAGQVKQAVDSGRALAESEPLSPMPLWSLAQVYQDIGSYRTAIPYYRQALKLIPDEDINTRIQYTLPIIHCYQALGSLDKAREVCQEAQEWAGVHSELQALSQQLNLSGNSKNMGDSTDKDDSPSADA